MVRWEGRDRNGDSPILLETSGVGKAAECGLHPSARAAAPFPPSLPPSLRQLNAGPMLRARIAPRPTARRRRRGEGKSGRRAIFRACLCMGGGSAPARFPLGSPCALDMTAAICLLSSSLSWLRSASTPAGTRGCEGAAGPPPSPAAAAPSSPSPPSKLASLPMAAAAPRSPLGRKAGGGPRSSAGAQSSAAATTAPRGGGSSSSGKSKSSSRRSRRRKRRGGAGLAAYCQGGAAPPPAHRAALHRPTQRMLRAAPPAHTPRPALPRAAAFKATAALSSSLLKPRAVGMCWSCRCCFRSYLQIKMLLKLVGGLSPAKVAGKGR